MTTTMRLDGVKQAKKGCGINLIQSVALAGLVVVLTAILVCATTAHLHPHSQFQQSPNGHLHDNTAHRQQGNQQIHQQQQQQPITPASPPTGSAGLFSSDAGKIIAPAAAGALLGAALQQKAGSGESQARPQRHIEEQHEEEAEKILIDLSHPLHNGTLHWPKFDDFQYTATFEGEKKSPSGESYFVKADAIKTAIHSGTHLDAPLHFSKTSWSVEKIPLNRLIDVPVSVVDVSEKVAANRSYNFVKADFLDSKTNVSLVKAKSVVLVYTGISELYDQGKKAYLGTETRNISEMRIPGFSGEAAQFLVDQGVYGVGLDSPSADSSERHGTNESYDPVAHVIFNTKNVYILENISAKLKELVNAPAARLTIAPLPIVNGSGSPVRLVAIIGHDECHCHGGPHNDSKRRHELDSSLSIILITLFLCLLALLL